MTTRISIVFSLMLTFFFIVTNCKPGGGEGTEAGTEMPEPAPNPDPQPDPANPILDGTTVPTAQQLWNLIAGDTPGEFAYRKWKTFPSLDSVPVPMSELPHGDWVSVYVNDVAHTSIQQQLASPQNDYSAPFGTVCIKENYPAGATAPPQSSLLSITVMYKIEGYTFAPGDAEGWYFAMYKPDGSGDVITLNENVPFINKPDNPIGASFSVFRGEVQAGKPWFCISCHRSAEKYLGPNFDYVGDYLFELKPFIVVN